MLLARDSQTQIPNLHRQLCVLKLFKSWRPYPAFVGIGACDLHASASAPSMMYPRSGRALQLTQ